MATTYTSVQNGNWNDPLTWGSASYPSVAGDIVNILHEVIYNVDSVVAIGDVTVSSNGILRYAKNQNTRLVLGNFNLNIGNGTTNGRLFIGDDAENPIPAQYTAILEFTPTADNSKGIFIKTPWAETTNSCIKVYGDKNYYGETIESTLVSNWSSGQTITVAGDLTTKWKVGQKLVLQNIYSSGAPSDTNPAKIQVVTIAGLTLNGSNTDILLSESWTYEFIANAIVTNISRNIKIKKFGASEAVGNKNTLRPKIDGSASYKIFPDYQNVIQDAEIIGFYNCSYSFHATFTNSVFKNGYYFSNNLTASNIYSGGPSEYYKLTRSENLINNCVFFSLQYCFYDNMSYKVANSYFIGNVNITNESSMMAFYDCNFILNQQCILATRLSNFYNCTFMQNSYTVYNSDLIYFENCMSWRNNRTCNRGGPLTFKRCYVGVNRNDEIGGTYVDDYDSVHDLYGTEVIFDECHLGLYHYPTGNRDVLKLRNCSFFGTAQYSSQQEFLEFISEERGNARVISCWQCRKNTTEKFVGNDSTHMKACAYSYESHHINNKIIEIEQQNVAATLQTRKIYVKSKYLTEVPSEEDVYFEVEYLNSASDYSVTTVKSTQRILYNDTWTELSVSFTPARSGSIMLRFFINKQLSVNLVMGEWGYYVPENEAEIFIDSAIWFSSTEYFKIPWRVGDYVESFELPDFPSEDNVKDSIIYNNGLNEGTLEIPIASDVREGVAIGSQIGTLDLPAEEDVEKGVIYDNGEKIGTFVPTYYGNIINIEVEVF